MRCGKYGKTKAPIAEYPTQFNVNLKTLLLFIKLLSAICFDRSKHIALLRVDRVPVFVSCRHKDTIHFGMRHAPET
jgi:hypothetical protein